MPDLVGAALLVTSLALLNLGIVKAADWGWASPEVVGSFVGAAVALVFFVVSSRRHRAPMLDPMLLRWSITIIAIALLALLVSGWRYHGAPSAPLSSGIGLIAGLFSGAAQLGGPPVVAYWLGGKSDFTRVRANVVLYFSISSVFSAISYYVGGLFVPAVFALTAVILPSYAVGLYGGSKLFGLAEERTFRIACYILIAAAAIIGMPLLDSVLR
jgi:uncharacterized membrane protein YfcA